MEILLLNPYHGGSHAAVAEGYAAHSRHTITLLTLPTTGGWRWRMRGAAVTLARMAREQSIQPDILLTTDMLDLATFRALTRDTYPPRIPAALYFHENQLSYPLPEHRPRDLSFAWVNYTSALVATAVFFNSAFHRRSFLADLPTLLNRYHDYRETENVSAIAAKSSVLPPGIESKKLRASSNHAHAVLSAPKPDHPPIILWNSRWDYDKQPQVFFAALEELVARGTDFRLIIAGEHVDPNAPEFVAARTRWASRLLHWGYADSATDYHQLLQQADIVVSTAIQEFFGISILEAIACGCIPILPNRLNYPDLLPVAYHADCLYSSFEELVTRLQHALYACNKLKAYDWAAIADPYDWSVLAPQYDAALEGISIRVSGKD